MTSSDPTATGRQRRLPNAIIIGVKKCGTRALLEFLRAHPDVRAPGPEVHFFDRHYDKGLNWYRSRMPMTSPGQLTIEKTPSYFVTPGVAERVYNMSRDIRLLVVVRDPVTRARSDFTQAASKRRRRCLQQSRLDVPHCGLERHPDARARRATFERRVFADKQQEKIDSSWSAINIGLYDRHLRHWLDWFPRHQLHFVHGEQLISDPAGQVRHVQHFLGLRTLVDREHFHFNATKGFPCVRRSRGSRGETVQCLGKTKGRHHPSVDGKVLVKLRDFYRPHNRRFYSLTGINFGWD